MQPLAEMTNEMATSTPGETPRSRTSRALGAFGAVCAALLALRFLVPTRMEGARGGLTGAIAWVGDEHPLILGVGLFLALSATIHHWTTRRARSFEEPIERHAIPRSNRRFLLALAAAAVAAFITRSSLVATFRVSGPSMLPTLEIGDRVLVNRLAYGLEVPFTKTRLGQQMPARGDLVVFAGHGLLPGDRAQEVVKRVIGVPGDRIQVAAGAIAINGWSVPTCDAGPYVATTGRLIVRGRLTLEYLGDKTFLTVHTPFDTETGNYYVRENEVFVMGDDRGLSSDSRVWNEKRASGVPLHAIEGRVNRVLLGGLPDGRLDLSRLLAPAFGLEVRARGIDTTKTRERIETCLKERPSSTWPPAAGSGTL
jgi:signal peptidase I